MASFRSCPSRLLAASAALLGTANVGSGAFADVPPSATLTSTFALNDGRKMPVMGLGVYMSKPGPETENAVRWALEAGYRMIDTAAIYRNEESVGNGIKASGVQRSDLFLATKLWDADHGYDEAKQAAQDSLRKLGVDYLDLYLVHSPNSGKLVETWDALLELQGAGLVRSIGVSNYGIPHLQALEEHRRPMPAVNQIELHPLNWKARRELLDYCKERGILVQAYGSMFFGKSERLAEDAVAKVANSKMRTPAQVLLRWGHQMGFQIIPKSVREQRIRENANIFDFELNEEEMTTLSAMEGELGAYWQPLGATVHLGDVHHMDRTFRPELYEAAPRPESSEL